MAHEIKNPLTPIQLSAERIAKSYRRTWATVMQGANGKLEGVADESRVGAVIAECTETISREVAGLKAMVDEFSRLLAYRRRDSKRRLNEWWTSCRPLRRQARRSNNRFESCSELPAAMLDRANASVFVNLIDNALDALLKLAVRRGM